MAASARPNGWHGNEFHVGWLELTDISFAMSQSRSSGVDLENVMPDMEMDLSGKNLQTMEVSA